MNQRTPFFYLFCLLSLVATIYIILGAYAVVYLQEIPFIPSIAKAKSSHAINSVIDNGQYQTRFTLVGASPEAILDKVIIPKNGTRLSLTKGAERDGSWYFRPSQGHYILEYAQTSTGPKLKEVIIYMPINWRTIPDMADVAIGDNIFIETDQSVKYVFRITDRSVIRQQDIFVNESAPTVGISLFAEDTATGQIYAFRGKILDAQEAQ